MRFILCRAVLGDWLQIVYKNEAAAWVVSVSHAGDHSIFATEFPSEEVFTPRTAALRRADKVYQKKIKREKENYRGPRRLIELLPMPLQKKFQHICDASPFKPTPEDLRFPVEYDEDGSRKEPKMVDAPDMDAEYEEQLMDPQENWFTNFIV